MELRPFDVITSSLLCFTFLVSALSLGFGATAFARDAHYAPSSTPSYLPPPSPPPPSPPPQLSLQSDCNMSGNWLLEQVYVFQEPDSNNPNESVWRSHPRTLNAIIDVMHLTYPNGKGKGYGLDDLSLYAHADFYSIVIGSTNPRPLMIYISDNSCKGLMVDANDDGTTMFDVMNATYMKATHHETGSNSRVGLWIFTR